MSNSVEAKRNGRVIVVHDYSDYLFEAMEEAAKDVNIRTVTTYCPHCRNPIMMPVMVTKEDVDVFNTVMNGVHEHLMAIGIHDSMIKRIMRTCLDAIRRRDDG